MYSGKRFQIGNSPHQSIKETTDYISQVSRQRELWL